MQKLKDSWLELLCTACFILGLALFLCGCNSYDKLPLEPFNSDIMSSTYTAEYGVAYSTDLKLFTIYGKYPVGDKTVPAGVCISMQKLSRFPIKDLLAKYPDLQSQQALKAAEDQKL